MDYAFGIRYENYFHNLKPWRGSLVFRSSSFYILFLFCDLLRYFSLCCGIEITSAG